MRIANSAKHTRFGIAIALALLAAPVAGYVGPGAGLGMLGSLVGLLAGLLLGLLGLVWYPLRNWLRRRKKTARERADSAPRND